MLFLVGLGFSPSATFFNYNPILFQPVVLVASGQHGSETLEERRVWDARVKKDPTGNPTKSVFKYIDR